MRKWLLLLPIALCASPLVEGNNTFAWDFYREVAKSGGNLAISPFALTMNLSMPYLGAREETANQMRTTLHYPQMSAEDLAHDFHNLHDVLVPMSVVVGMWLPANEPVLHSFQSLVSGNYSGGLQEATFRTPSMMAVEINQWMNDRTGGKIRRPMDPMSLNMASKIVLTSGFTIETPWLLPFAAKDTKKISWGKKTVSMMRRSHRLPYMESDQFSMVALPFEHKTTARLALVILLPKEGLEEIEKVISYDMVEKALDQMEIKAVDVTIPKFETSTRLYARHFLHRLGITDAFTLSADFSGIDGQGDLLISTVVHQAMFKIGEEGAGDVKEGQPLPEEHVEVTFKADRPFLYILIDTNTGQYLLLGRFTG